MSPELDEKMLPIQFLLQLNGNSSAYDFLKWALSFLLGH